MNHPVEPELCTEAQMCHVDQWQSPINEKNPAAMVYSSCPPADESCLEAWNVHLNCVMERVDGFVGRLASVLP